MAKSALARVVQGAVGLFLLSPFDGEILVTTVLGAALVADAAGVKVPVLSGALK